MAESVRALLAAYLRQQQELDTPAYVFASPSEAAGSTVSQTTLPGIETPPPAPQPPPSDDRREELKKLFYAVRDCTTCALGRTRTRLVFGAGNAAASVLVVGEAPGEEEDRQGLPFVGAAGNLLTKMLAAIDLDRKKDVFITNIVKCRPPENRDPADTEIVSCAHILARQIEVIRPATILVLGRVAAHTLLETTKAVGELRQTMHNYKGIPLVVTYHPAALLRNSTYKRPAWEDLQRLRGLLRK